MSDPGLIAALLEPNLAAEGNRAALLEVYVRRVFSIERESGYAFFYERRAEILPKLGSAEARAEFLLQGWLAADPPHWADWAEELRLEPSSGQVLSDLCARVAAMLISSSTSINTPSEIEAAADHAAKLAPGLLGLDQAELGLRLENAAAEALGEKWWEDEEALDRQVARHRLIAAVEHAAPEARGLLIKERSKDATWPIGEEAPIDGTVLRGWRRFAEELNEETYDEIVEAIPRPDSGEQPSLFAEALATEMVIRGKGSFAGGRSVVRGHLDRIKALNALGGEYRHLLRVAAGACVNLGPSANQLAWLLYFIGRDPDSETVDAVACWSQGAGRGPSATLVKEVMPLWVAGDWMPHLARLDYEEAPVLERVRAVMFEDGSAIDKRLRYARALRDLGLRTKGGPDKVAKLIVDLLTPTRKHHRRNDLRVALLLCECLGPNHKKQASIEKALRAYSKKWKCNYTPDQYRSVLRAGVTLPEIYLSKEARRGLDGLVAEVREIGSGVAGAISRLNPF